ncbi:hypothetical protein [Tuwongella immobilis]|uniref:Uncharacterized protein n=1 Tax=Tuwongella immobilis TaxID=692036 RepID=A0A6C2YHK1_9BACT|nr:hypothetical protein [Tuwongella immobilis]VIP00613.1 Uncharacterized protein OS=Planctomyces limnophilus (strain ATCC 43296 / DSM 3776 / IFAM 1008 / 290) GN=Plim_3412 PE=4 SV=1 [Tuwongella immobilis]VTR96644.1 Uncharacterized protein OS=Planctomyces limnophilus (strain ATCC 43296 / DSM 3776 / IFAM 1008 / 290) GN=Plim_3412 PE=4 SV=1 [Tuwongella immobilis]
MLSNSPRLLAIGMVGLLLIGLLPMRLQAADAKLPGKSLWPDAPIWVATPAGANADGANADGADAIFPQSWQKPPISARGKPIADAEWPRVKAMLQRALAKYPPAVLKRHLEAVYLVEDLEYNDVRTGGTNSRTAVYLSVGSVKRGYTDAHLERVFHAEFSSILYRNARKSFDAAAWEAVNPARFSYQGNGVDAVKNRKAGTQVLAQYNAQGFLSQYSQSNRENDFNAFAGMLFLGDTAGWKACDEYPSLRIKRQLAIAFYQQIDPMFTESFFRNLQGKKSR